MKDNEAKRVAKPGGKIAVVFWGRPQDCETNATLKAICSAGPVVKAIRAVGEQKVYETVLASLLPYKRSSGGYRQCNTFRYFITVA